MTTVSVRYIVDDVDAAIAFYRDAARVRRGHAPGAAVRDAVARRPPPRSSARRGGRGGGGQAMPDGTLPEPGGWNRFQLEVADLDGEVDACGRPARASAATS